MNDLKYFRHHPKVKWTKREMKIFVDKSYLLILTFPLKDLDNKFVNSLPKIFPKLNISICFSKNATRNSFFHCYFRIEEPMVNKNMISQMQDECHKVRDYIEKNFKKNKK